SRDCLESEWVRRFESMPFEGVLSDSDGLPETRTHGMVLASQAFTFGFVGSSLQESRWCARYDEEIFGLAGRACGRVHCSKCLFNGRFTPAAFHFQYLRRRQPKENSFCAIPGSRPVQDLQSGCCQSTLC